MTLSTFFRRIPVPTILGLMLVLSIQSLASAQLPSSYQEFKSRYQTEAMSPEGALKLHFEAIFCYLDPAMRSEAGKMLRYSMYLPMPLEQSKNNATFVDRMKAPSMHHIFRSFAVGTSPENSYSMNPDRFRLNIVGKRNSEGFLKIALKSSGADSTRIVWMRKHDGLWYTDNNAAVYSQVREPKQAIDARKNMHDVDFDVPSERRPSAPHDADAPSSNLPVDGPSSFLPVGNGPIPSMDEPARQ